MYVYIHTYVCMHIYIYIHRTIYPSIASIVISTTRRALREPKQKGIGLARALLPCEAQGTHERIYAFEPPSFFGFFGQASTSSPQVQA